MLTEGLVDTGQIVAEANRALDLSVIVPTFNERDNVGELVSRLKTPLKGLAWELIVVDDDSPDGTSELVRDYSFQDRRIRLLRRVGRRGLASACIEGMLAASSAAIAVMDADLQRDESILPLMLQKLREEELDLVLGTRNADGGSMGSFSARRVLLSRCGQRISRFICPCELSDPMSGFFLVRRSFFLDVADRLNGDGFKILLDLVASSTRPVRVGEVGYRFRNRRFGESKLDLRVAFEYFAMILDKFSKQKLQRTI
jgi:dolichol-phosphate mannosyltransferase